MLKKYIEHRRIINDTERHVFSSQTHEKMSVSCIEEINTWEFTSYLLSRSLHFHLNGNQFGAIMHMYCYLTFYLPQIFLYLAN